MEELVSAEIRTEGDAAYFEMSDPSFSVLSEQVRSGREQNWYAQTNYGIAALRYEEVRSLLRDRRMRQGLSTWPLENGVPADSPVVDFWASGFVAKSGEAHARLRRLANPIFAPATIESLKPGFRSLTNELIDRIAARGRCEFIGDFCEEFSARILLQLLGVENHEIWRDLQRMAGDFALSLGVQVAAELPRVEAALAELYEFADNLVDATRRNAQETAIASLVAAHDNGELSEKELRIFIVDLIFGGLDTTKNQLGIALSVFLEHPDQWDLLAERPELAPRATEEVLRIRPTVLWITRHVTEDMVIGGLEVPEGTTVHLMTQPANTDPRVGADGPFDISAENPQHLTFGAGPHHCVGHLLARTDIGAALPVLAQRLRNLRADGPAIFRPWSGVGGPIELPIAFDAAPAA
ncbi:cytochrome P450 [Nocardia pseudovaccinii]|uniref:cytochrome P450 n=1 Tax=Nocardia pseudovaccinii TaxID=189540 RepID=UPI003D93FD62